LKTVFLTGGTGFVGSHTAGQFLANGWRVKVLVRDPTRVGRLPDGTERVQGEVLSCQKYRAAMQGCDAVVHVAGAVKALDLISYRSINSGGAQAVARTAAEACPAAMFVLVSSQAAAGPAREGVPVTEADKPRPVSWYGLSKLEGEDAVARAFPGTWCAIRPCVVYGPGDPGLLEIFRVIQSGLAPIIAGGRRRLQLIAVADLARMLVAAADRPDLSGRRGFAATDIVSMGELALYIAGLRHPPAKPFPLPAIAIRAAGMVDSVRQWVTHRPRPFNRDKAREMLQGDWLCDAGPMLRDLLGIEGPLTHWKEGLRDVCRCYLRDQWLRQNIWAV
jgi:nucleoside-diphosphate-sugar epimerase